MDRRFVVSQQQSGTSGASHHSSSSHVVRSTNSFIPTSSSHHSHHGHGNHHGKHQSSSSLQQHGNNHISNSVSSSSMQTQQNGPHANYYQNMSNNHSGTLGSRLDHHQQLLHHQQQQQMHQRTLTKTYSSHSSHYSSSNPNNNSSANHNAYYGNGNPSTIIMNGGSSHQIQNSYSQIHLQQQQQHQYQQSQLQFQQQLQLQQLHSNHYHQAETEGLPATLVESMRTLFDILDDTKQGKIRLSDIESRWESDSNGNNGKSSGAEPLIKMGVMGYLRKVTPADGMLTFDRFCAGLRLALITNNNNPSTPNQNPSQPVSSAAPSNLYEARAPQGQSQSQVQYGNHQTFQQQVKNMTNNVHSSASNNSNKIPANAIIMNGNAHGGGSSSSNNNTNTNNKSNAVTNSSSVSVAAPQAQNNTLNRSSKIPSLSASRLPMPNSGSSGIPVSPNNRVNGNFSSSNGTSNGTGIPLPNSNSNSMKRQPNNPEQGTTVALVHHPPHPNPKPVGLHPPSYSSNGGTLKMTKHNSTSGLPNRYGTKNGSLDNLKTSNEDKMGLPTKDRPPSAPLLDGDAENGNSSKEHQEEYYTHARRNRERARSHDREREDHGHHGKKERERETSEDGKRVNFVTPRQRTLSMPQLQLSKLKPKSSSIPIDDSPPEKIRNFGSNTLKSSGSHNKSQNPLVSSIPTISSVVQKQKIEHSPPSKDNSVVIVAHPERAKEQPPPPPKPPRNVNGPPGVTIPVTISTSLLANAVGHEPPLSGSSNGSVSSKPEIRNVLQSWQKGMTDKKPVEATLSVASVTTTSSVNTNCTSATAPAAINAPPGGEVKLRTNTKTNLRRRETPRRHTVQSGIDFSTLKRLKQLEQERDVLQQGISYLENAKDWYAKQLESADEKIELLSKGAPTSDYWSESHEERLNLLGCRISEVNSLLTALMDGSSRLPLHMNLQIPSHLSLRTITRLKEQNRQLTQEVSDCSHRVTQLETEKAMLLRQLFHQKNNLHSDETVYM